MRHHRRDQLHQRADRGAAAGRRCGLFHRAGQFVDPRHRLVEAERFDVRCHCRDRLVRLAVERLVSATRGPVELTKQAPQAVDEARAAFDPRFRPWQIAFGRTVAEHEPAHRIRAVAIDDRIGIDDVLFRLRHLDDAANRKRRSVGLQCRGVGAALHLVGRKIEDAPLLVRALICFMRHHPLREQRSERFGHVDQADAVQRARPEARVEQVQDRMLDSADILFDRQPFRDLVPVERLVLGLTGEAQEIPGGIDEGVERVGLANGLAAASGAIDMLPAFVPFERIARRLEIDIIGQNDRQAGLGRGHDAARIAMNEGDRRPPIALARNAPIAQAPDGLALAATLLLDPRDDFALGVLHAHSVEEVGIDDHALSVLRLALERLVGLLRARRDDARDREIVFGGEFEVALVVAGHAHHRAGAVSHQHEIRDIDGQVRAGERVFCSEAGVEAELFRRFQLRRCRPALLAQSDEIARRVSVERLGHRMVGGDGDEARAEDRVGPGRIDRQPAAIRKIEAEFEPLRLADPVFLHQPDLVGPVFETAQPFQQFLGEVGDLQEPLRQFALLDLGTRAPALAVDDLFVGEHGHVDRIPIDLALLAIDKARFVKVEEQRLFVAVIVRLAGRQLAAPVEREAEALQLRLHVFDIVAGPAAGMDALFHRGVFRWHAERVPAHRVENLVPRRLLVAREYVAHRVIADMADMDAPAGIGEHLEHVALRLVAIAVGAEGLCLVPCGLPLGISLRGIEGRRMPLPGARIVHRVPLRVSSTRFQPAIVWRRNSRAFVRMMSSSFCTVAA